MSLEQMDKFGIGVAILSMTQNGDLLYNGTEKGRAAVRAGNEYGARLMQQHPTKFGLMGGIPMPDLEGSLKEVAYAYDTLKVDAIGIYTNDNQGAVAGRPLFRAAVAGAEPAQRHRLHASAGAARAAATLQIRRRRRRWWNTTSTSPAASPASSSTA